MRLSKTAAKAWRTHRDALRRIARDEREPSRLLLTGGSILNAEWSHRESIDIDMLLPERRSVNDLGPERRLDLQAAVGGKIIRQTRYRITARTPEGILDITAMKPELEGCEREIEIEGATETVLSTAQILRGKLERIKKALPRDAFDLITAAKAEPAALEIAVNALSSEQRVTAAEHLRESNAKIAATASETLAGVPEHYRRPTETMGLDAAHILRQHEYVRVQIFRTRDGITVLTVPRHGTPRATSSSDDARTALRDLGISEYLDTNSTVSSYEVEKALDALTRRREEGLVLDSGDDEPRDRTRSITRSDGANARERVNDEAKNLVRGRDRAVGGGNRTENRTRRDEGTPHRYQSCDR